MATQDPAWILSCTLPGMPVALKTPVMTGLAYAVAMGIETSLLEVTPPIDNPPARMPVTGSAVSRTVIW